MTPTIATCVVHAAHLPDRARTMARLREQLFVRPSDERAGWPYREETTRGHWTVWAELAWSWLAEQRATHALVLQDDVELAPNFWRVLTAMVAGRPDDVIGLDCAHPAARRFFLAGAPGYTTSDGMIGIGYVLPLEQLRELLAWKRTAVKPSALTPYATNFGEDLLIALWCMATGRRIFHPTPTPIDHDLEVTSTNPGYDDHWYRRPQASWTDLDRLEPALRECTAAAVEQAEFWARPVEHVGRFYEPIAELATALVDTEHGAAALREIAKDECPRAHRRFFLRVSG